LHDPPSHRTLGIMTDRTSVLDRIRTPAGAAMLVRLGGTYVLLGALMKVFAGSPGDLPNVLLDAMPRHAEGLFMLAATLELFVGLVAVLTPRLGWAFLALLLTSFLVVLVLQVIGGERSCGCFGSALTLPPILMILIDAALMAAVLLARPWVSLRDAPWRAWSAAVAVPVVASALAYLSTATAEPEATRSDPLVERMVDASRNDHGQEQLNPSDDSEHPSGDPRPAINPEDPSPPVRSAGPPRPRGEWQPPERFPRYVVLKPWQWTGKPIWETQLATWVDTSEFPLDATVILYLDTCEHCAEHLHALADLDDDETEYVLVQLPTPSRSPHPTRVFRLPPGLHVKLPSATRWNLRVPWELRLEGGVVVDAVDLRKD
jgi:hypothetical protein